MSVTGDDFAYAMNLLLGSVVFGIRHAAPIMKDQGPRRDHQQLVRRRAAWAHGRLPVFDRQRRREAGYRDGGHGAWPVRRDGELHLARHHRHADFLRRLAGVGRP